MVRPGFTGQSMHRYRTHTCGALRESDIGQEVRLSGWCHRIRDHGGVLFIDLRDHYGITQVVADPDSPAFKTAEDRKSTRLNSSHANISYAVFCLKKKNNSTTNH